MRHARLDEKNVVIEVFDEHSGFTIDECFPPATAALFIECPNNTTPHSVLNANGSWTIFEPPPEPGPEPEPKRDIQPAREA